MNSLSTRMVGRLVGLTLVAAVEATTTRSAQAALPPLPNTVQQWNKIAEDTVVGSGAFQGEGEVYMSYVATAVYDAAVAIEGGFEPYGPAINAPAGASLDCAVVEAAYRTLRITSRPFRHWLRASTRTTPRHSHPRTWMDAQPTPGRERASDWRRPTASSIFVPETGA